MKSTIKDVARLANVSMSTVSRYINGADNLKPSTQERIQKAILQLNYYPNKIAQSLGSRLRSIGVVATRSSEMAFSNPYFSDVLKGIGTVTEAHQYDLILCSSEDEKREIDRCLSLIDSQVVQGLILLSSRIYDNLIHELLKKNFPFVVIGRVLPETLPDQTVIYTVDTPNYDDCYMLTEYLLSRGHKKIAFIHAPSNYVVSHDRLQGFQRALIENGIIPHDEWLINGGYTWEDAYQATRKMLAQPAIPTAIFASDDLKAVGACKACKHVGFKIPEDISIVGHNDFDLASIHEPALTTIHVPIHDLGVTAATQLLNLISGAEIEPQVILPTRLIERDSVRSLICEANDSDN